MVHIFYFFDQHDRISPTKMTNDQNTAYKDLNIDAGCFRFKMTKLRVKFK